MVTIITEKLQQQTLDDVQFEPIKQPARRSCEPTLTSSPVSPFNFSGKKDHSGESQYWKHEVNTSTRHSSTGSTGQCSLVAPLVCIHSLPMLQCSVCNSVFGNQPPAAPPKKRHCRSLSIPGDSKCSRKWQPQASSVWRPVPMRPHSAKMLRTRHSPLGPHRNKSNEASPIQGYNNMPAPHTHTQPQHSQSPRGGILRTLTPGSDIFSTPPDSPIPRPASASSGFWDSSQGSLNVTWGLDTSPSSVSNRNSAFRFRSLSMEDPISPPPPPVSAKSCAAGSMPVIPSHEGAAPLSPHRHRVPRCRSQPCVLPERKCGVKRRRDDDRPTIDLFKMKETAYTTGGVGTSSRSGNSSGAKCVQFACQDAKCGRGMSSLLTEPPECFLGLNTIASSPLDSCISLSAQLVTPKSSPKKAVKFDGAVHSAYGEDTDSGCDDVPVATNPPDLVAFPPPSSSSPLQTFAKDGEDALFELEMSSDLDLEQIEKD